MPSGAEGRGRCTGKKMRAQHSFCVRLRRIREETCIRFINR
jgi:hypothetical protein